MRNNKNKNLKKEDVNTKIFTSSLDLKPQKLQRKCAGCNKTLERTSLIRILKCHKTQQLILQPDANSFGRSLYLCPKTDCLNQILKKKRIQRVLKTDLPEEIIENIKDLIIKKVE
jgi:hypothetical protein